MTKYFHFVEGRISDPHARDEEARKETGMVVVHNYGYPNEPRWVANYSRFIRNAQGYTQNVKITQVYQEGSRVMPQYSATPLEAVQVLKRHIRTNGVR